MNDDAGLLRRYAEEGSEAAFTELVRRHVDLVYGAALRRTGGDPHRAADVAQHVFTTLARQARKLSRHAVLSAWLHTATRNAALNLMISEQRRKARESQALDPALATNDAQPEWERLRPVLDAAIDELPESDRAAVVLRFLERRPFGEIGRALQLSEDAARMRTERALDKLRMLLARRGITSTAAAVGAVVSTQSLIAAPAGLAASIAATSFASTSAGGSLLAIALTSLMNLKIIATGAALVAAFGIGAYLGLMQHLDAPPPPAIETPRHSQMIAELRKENSSLRAQVDQLKTANAQLAAPRPPPPPPARAASTPAAPQPKNTVEVVAMQRAMLNNLRQISAARDQFQLENRRPPTSVEELVGETKYIRRLNPVDGESYNSLALGAGQPLTLTSPNGVSVTYDPAGAQTTRVEMPPPPPHLLEMAQRMHPAIEKALAGYQAANHGAKPPNSEAGAAALIPYFSTPQEGADFVEYMEAVKKSGRMP